MSHRRKAIYTLVNWGRAWADGWDGPSRYPDPPKWTEWIVNRGDSVERVRLADPVDDAEALEAHKALEVMRIDYRPSYEVLKQVFRERIVPAKRYEHDVDRAIEIFQKIFG